MTYNQVSTDFPPLPSGPTFSSSAFSTPARKKNLNKKHKKVRVRWGVRYPGPRDVWDPDIAQKYKVRQSAPFKKKLKIYSPEGPRENVSLGPAVALDGPAHKVTGGPVVKNKLTL